MNVFDFLVDVKFNFTAIVQEQKFSKSKVRSTANRLQDGIHISRPGHVSGGPCTPCHPCSSRLPPLAVPVRAVSLDQPNPIYRFSLPNTTHRNNKPTSAPSPPAERQQSKLRSPQSPPTIIDLPTIPEGLSDRPRLRGTDRPDACCYLEESAAV